MNNPGIIIEDSKKVFDKNTKKNIKKMKKHIVYNKH